MMHCSRCTTDLFPGAVYHLMLSLDPLCYACKKKLLKKLAGKKGKDKEEKVKPVVIKVWTPLGYEKRVV